GVERRALRRPEARELGAKKAVLHLLRLGFDAGVVSRRPVPPPAGAAERGAREPSGMKGEELRDDVRAQRITQKVRAREVEVVEQAHEVERHLDAVLRSVVRLCATAVTAQIEAYDAIVLRQAVGDARPPELTLEAAAVRMHEHDRRTVPALDVADGNAVRVEELLHGALRLAVDLPALLDEFHRLGLHAFAQRGLVAEAVLLRIVAHILRDLHGAEVRPAHRAEVRELGTVLRQRFIVKLARLVRIEAEVELILPAELEARLGQRVVAQLRAGMAL